jgi:probable rRNA maturation factor
MIVQVINKQKDLKVSTPQIKRLVKHAIEAAEVACDEVGIYLVDRKKICQLHQEFFNDPSPTDCISFPLDDDETPFYRVLGEVFVCPATAIDYSAAHHSDPYEELTLYIIHGLLHLIGYDDIEDHERRKMREAEKYHLNLLKNKELILKLN